jgi:ribosomal protein S18 acetylase RimI-like enzyme
MAETDLIIRPASLLDIPAIQELSDCIWPIAYGSILSKTQIAFMLKKMYSTEALTHQMKQLNHHFLMLEAEGLPRGFASFSAHTKQVYRLHKLYILTDFQGRSAGKKLLQTVIEHSKEQGASALELNVNRHNKAIDFYKKNGFTIVREEDIDIGSGFFMNDYVMQLSL